MSTLTALQKFLMYTGGIFWVAVFVALLGVLMLWVEDKVEE
jgi:hypothetical protein